MLKRRYILVPPLLALIALVLSFCVADLFAGTATEYESQWRKEEMVKSIQEWDKAVAALSMAIRLNPWNPHYPEVMGRLYIWRYYIANDPVQSPEHIQRILDEGMSYVQASIAMRPTWQRVHSTKRRLNRAAEDVRLSLNE